jgi:hypothetical protein
MNADRIDKLEEKMRPAEESQIEYLDIRIVYEETLYQGEEKICRAVPATYDEAAPYGEAFWHPGKKKMVAVRVLYPIEETHGILPDDVTK